MMVSSKQTLDQIHILGGYISVKRADNPRQKMGDFMPFTVLQCGAQPSAEECCVLVVSMG
jgi:hypothetical protein